MARAAISTLRSRPASCSSISARVQPWVPAHRYSRNSGCRSRLTNLAHKIVLNRNWPVERFRARPDTGWDALQNNVRIWIEEEHEREATGLGGEFARRIDNAVKIGEPNIVGPSHHQVANVDDQRVSGGNDAHPFARLQSNLQTTRCIFLNRKNCDSTVVSMNATS